MPPDLKTRSSDEGNWSSICMTHRERHDRWRRWKRDRLDHWNRELNTIVHLMNERISPTCSKLFHCRCSASLLYCPSKYWGNFSAWPSTIGHSPVSDRSVDPYLAGIIMWNAFVNICTVRTIDNRSFCWIPWRRRKGRNIVCLRLSPLSFDVLATVCDIVVHHHDNIWVGNAISMENLISMANIGLVPIVVPAVRSGDEHCPVRGIGSLA